LKIIFKISGCY